MLRRLNHVGIVTPSIPAAIERHRALFGAVDASGTIDLPEQGVRAAFLRLANAEIELIEPLKPDSPVAKFLAKNPAGGQHHVCYEVDDLIAARDALVAQGAAVLRGGEPRVGAHGVPVIFLHPRDTGGVLVELMAAPAL